MVTPSPQSFWLKNALVLLLASLFSLATASAAPGELDVGFDAGALVSPPSSTQIAIQPDGKVLVGGAFTSLQGIPRNRIARLNADGTLDTAFLNGLSGASSAVYAIALQTNGLALVGGDFMLMNGISRGRIARLDLNGNLDASFLNGLTGANDWVECLRIQNDNKVLLGGYFTSVNDTGRNFLARLNSDGSLDSSFLNGLSGANNAVFALALQPDGKIIVGGAYTNFNGVAANYLCRLNSDGSVDNSFLNGLPGPDNVVNAVVLQPDGKILIGGAFGLVNGTARSRMARLNVDGTLDSPFLNIQSGTDGDVYCLALQNDGKILVGGAFFVFNGFFRNHFVRLNANGIVDDWFLHRKPGADDFVSSFGIQTDGKVLIGGNFSSVNGFPRNQVARLLTAYSPVTMEEMSFDNGLFSFQLAGTPGQTLVIQASTDLTNWTSLRTNFLALGPPSFTDLDSPAFAKRFYRLQKL